MSNFLYNSLLRKDPDPNARWSSAEIQKELNNLDATIDNIDSGLLKTTGDQSGISGQKVFYNLYSNTGLPTYLSVMKHLQSDITPITGTGALGLTGTIQEEFAITKPNASFNLATIASLNPVFRRSPLSIYRAYNSNTVTINYAKNIPLAAYDLFKNGEVPPLNQDTIKTEYWATSQSVAAGSVSPTASDNTQYCVIARYNDSTDTTDITILDVNSASTIADTKSYRKLFTFQSTPEGNASVNAGTKHFMFENGELYYGHRYDIQNSTIGSWELSDFEKAPILVVGQIEPVSLTSVTSNVTLSLDGEPFLSLDLTTTGAFCQHNMTITIPFIWNNGAYPVLSLGNNVNFSVVGVISGGLY
jgi:hypothetical protein